MAQTPRSVKEFLDFGDQALFEMEELVTCVDEDLDDEMVDLAQPFASICHALRQVLEDVKRGEYLFADSTDLPFMSLANNYRHVIPVYSLLDSLNRAHRSGIA